MPEAIQTALIFCDVGGEYDCLDRLIAKAPKVDKYVFVGDLNDRGPKSKEVIERAMREPDWIVLDSNHGDMFIDAWMHWMDADYQMLYDRNDFTNNGGMTTLASYGYEGGGLHHAFRLVPPAHISWLSKLPLFFELPGLIVSHAPIHPAHWTGLMNPKLKGDHFHYVWNRGDPVERKGLLQVFGHNSHLGLKRYGDWAMCIDTTRKGCMKGSTAADGKPIRGQTITALHWPSLELYQEPHEEERVKKVDPEASP